MLSWCPDRREGIEQGVWIEPHDPGVESACMPASDGQGRSWSNVNAAPGERLMDEDPSSVRFDSDVPARVSWWPGLELGGFVVW